MSGQALRLENGARFLFEGDAVSVVGFDDPSLVLEFLQVCWRTIHHYGVDINGRRYDGAVLEGYCNTVSPHGGRSGGNWPLRVNPDDVRSVFFQDPADNTWHALEWEHARMIEPVKLSV